MSQVLADPALSPSPESAMPAPTVTTPSTTPSDDLQPLRTAARTEHAVVSIKE